MRAADLECAPMSNSDLGGQAQAGIACTPADARVGDFTLLAFDGSDDLQQAWRAELAALDPRLESTEDACESAAGTRKWGFGSLACSIDADKATLTWTDGRTTTLGKVAGAGQDLAALYAWWREEGRRLGRSGADPDATSEPEPETSAPPLQRSPGAPTAFSCDAEGERIIDEHGRTWRVNRVRFVDRPNYERVVLQLQRIGRNRSPRPTRIVTERLAADSSSLPARLRLRRGNTALVLRMRGVREAPNLRRFRPSGLSVVRELSLAGQNGGRTVVIGIPGGACHQVRVPVWGPSATGNERSAEVFIDIRG